MIPNLHPPRWMPESEALRIESGSLGWLSPVIPNRTDRRAGSVRGGKGKAVGTINASRYGAGVTAVTQGIL